MTEQWTVEKAAEQIEYMRSNLADSDVYLSSESCEAIAYLVEQARHAPTEDEWATIDSALKTFTRESSDDLACLVVDEYRNRINYD